MKCEVIQDLLPLYVEDLCSNESKEIIGKHLVSCEKCRKNQNTLLSDLNIETAETSQVNDYLREKDLLSHSKEILKAEGFNRVLNIIFHVIFILNLLFIFLLPVSIMLGYHVKYPQISWNEIGASYFGLILIVLLPIIICMLGIFVVKKKTYKKKYKRTMILCSILLIPTLLISILGGILIFVIPPVKSYTNDVENYLIIDDELDQYTKTIDEFFPKKIPENAFNVHYSYNKYSNFFGDTLEIKVLWNLPIDEYSNIKQQIKELGYLEKKSDKKEYYQIYLKGVSYPEGLKTYIEYDDSQNMTSYTLTDR